MGSEKNKPKLKTYSDGSWKLTFKAKKFQAKLGQRAVPFCQAVVGLNRMMSLWHLMYLGRQIVIPEIPAARNRWAVFILSVGCTREIVRALDSLRRSKIERDLTESRAAWSKIDEIGKRWNGKDFYDLRNKLAFHVDEEIIQEGLNLLIYKDKTLEIGKGASQRSGESTLAFGDDISQAGFFKDFDRSKIETMVTQIASDQEALYISLQEILGELLTKD